MTGSDHPENQEDGRGTTSCTETPTIQNAVKIPQAQFIDRITVVPVGIQRQTPTIQSPQQPLEVAQTHFLIQWQMPVDGRVQAWTRLALDSFKGSNPVWRSTGHNEPVDGRVQTWTRHVSEPTQCQRAQARHVHSEVCERIGRDQPIEVGEGAVSERPPPVLTVSGNPLATRHTHVTTTGCRQLDRSRRKGSQRDPILWIPFLCIQSDRPTRVGEGVLERHLG